jgi:hypothetical protein
MGSLLPLAGVVLPVKLGKHIFHRRGTAVKDYLLL